MKSIRSFIKKHLNTIEKIRVVMAVIFGVMVVVDIILAVFLKDTVPTFSEVVRDNRTQWLWLNFLLGGLIAKIFYNRKVATKRKELSGFFVVVVLSIVLAALAPLLPELDTEYHFLIMVSGGLVAHIAWPQYINDDDTV